MDDDAEYLLGKIMDKSDCGLDLSGLRQSLRGCAFSDEERKAAADLVALAHLADFSSDPRSIDFTVKYWENSGDFRALSELKRLAELYGQFKTVKAIHEIGLTGGRKELLTADFYGWFGREGVKWIDLYRDEEKGLAFVKPEEKERIFGLIRESGRGESEFWKGALTGAEDDYRLSPVRRELLMKLADNRIPEIKCASARRNQDRVFRSWAEKEGIKVIRCLQLGEEPPKRSSFVYLVLDRDGIIKVFKENLNFKESPLGFTLQNEDEIYRRLPFVYFLPRYYGLAAVSPNGDFLKQSFFFGTTLRRFMGKGRWNGSSAADVIRDLAKKLGWLTKEGVYFLDLKPENVIAGEGECGFIDFGLARFKDPAGDEITATIADPRYAPPETALAFRYGEKSLVFQLGLIFHELLAGEHPFALNTRQAFTREEEVVKYAWPNAVRPYKRTENIKDDRLGRIIGGMLDKNVNNRPTLQEVVIDLGAKAINLRLTVWPRPKTERKENTILFPARMGIPHRGHIEYISRLLDLGFYVLVSLQRSYTITDDDPLPKWQIMKMVAQSLFARGYSQEQFRFILTPFYRTDREHRLHFSMLPNGEEVVGVATSNPRMKEVLFPYRIYDQKALFGYEGREYLERSWGRRLRTAAKSGDYLTFRNLAASGVESIMTFAELQSDYARPLIEFVPGKVYAVLSGPNGRLVVKNRVARYETPEQSLVRGLKESGRDCQLIDPYSVLTEIRLDGKRVFLKYINTEFKEGNVIINYQCA
jgi:serine/threonine protein kinase